VSHLHVSFIGSARAAPGHRIACDNARPASKNKDLPDPHAAAGMADAP
jgi:hypothetical protein